MGVLVILVLLVCVLVLSLQRRVVTTSGYFLFVLGVGLL